MTEKPLISLSIVSHGDAQKVGQLLAGIQNHETNTGRMQVILVDNLGNDLPDFDASPWASLHIIRNKEQQGLAYNNNRAFDFAKGEYFSTLNPDLVFEEAVFDRLLATLFTYKVHLVAPQIIDMNGSAQDSFRPLPTPIELIHRRLPGYRFDAPDPDEYGLVHPDWIAGMFWLMPRDTYRTLNGMDEKFKLYLEDVDFCTRARMQGMRIIGDTNIKVRHDAQRTSRKNLYYLYLHTKSVIRFFTSPVYRQARRN